mmetsp:Transcript_14273/g.7040  ORF Transcript_14273/g.7040 Transcript_14273/m.7040 type:complete len:709 (+) Transcript_14273:148-2274(+)
MRKEITAIFLFFLVVFTLISLISYSNMDPSIHNAKAAGCEIHNLFGIFGSYYSGILIGAFGLGAFGIPVLLLLLSINFLKGKNNKSTSVTICGGFVVIIATGSLFSFFQNNYFLLGEKFSSGGIIGISLKIFLIRYTNFIGALSILIVLLIVGFMLATGFSITWFSKKNFRFFSRIKEEILIILIKSSEGRKKTKKEKTKEGKQKIQINMPVLQTVCEKPASKQEIFKFAQKENESLLPSVKLLNDYKQSSALVDNANLTMQSKLLEKKLSDFGVKGKVVAIIPGPVITTFEYKPASGVKINKIVNLTDDLALALRAVSIRIVAPIPGKAAVGIEVPNKQRNIVKFKEIVTSSAFSESKTKLTLCMGKDIVGNPVISQLDKMPHLLIAGATGSGKSVALNAMICSLLYKATPEEVRMIMVDPKRIELSDYNGIPHLITPVVIDVRKATNALFWAVHEMERRYELLSNQNSRNVSGYNKKIENKKRGSKHTPEVEELETLPSIVIIIDELADLMVIASKNVEVALMRLAQMARAASIHLILATQRPSVDVLTGIIKANFPTRMTFQVSSKIDSRTIIDSNGAENLLGNGDMLFLPPGTSKIQRIHGAYISDDEVKRVTNFLKEQSTPDYDENIVETVTKEKESSKEKEYDEKYDEAVMLVTKTRAASISMVQRHLRVGYNRAARIIEMMEEEGVVGPSDGVKPRKVLMQ